LDRELSSIISSFRFDSDWNASDGFTVLKDCDYFLYPLLELLHLLKQSVGTNAQDATVNAMVR